MMRGRARDERPNLGQPGLAAKQLMADSGHQAGTASSQPAEDRVGPEKITCGQAGRRAADDA